MKPLALFERKSHLLERLQLNAISFSGVAPRLNAGSPHKIKP
jgi:hypothetical protein